MSKKDCVTSWHLLPSWERSTERMSVVCVLLESCVSCEANKAENED